MKRKQQDLYVAHALKEYAKRIMNSEQLVSKEEGEALDRALRCCRGFSDTDPFFALWEEFAEQKGFLTSNELRFSAKTGYCYPDYVSQKEV